MAHILVVEDDPAMGAVVCRGLIAEGYEVTLVDNGIDALIAIAEGDFSAAAIDVMLPEMTGFEICRQLRKQGNRLPVLLLTARDAIEDRVLGLDSGADDYLTKPFAFAEFSARMRALVRRDSGSAGARTTVRIGRLELDSGAVRVRSDDGTIALSTKEFALLWLLATHAGATLSRHQILDEVWGTTQNIDQTIVDQYISYLRKKLAPDTAGITIATVRGAGYRLDEGS